MASSRTKSENGSNPDLPIRTVHCAIARHSDCLHHGPEARARRCQRGRDGRGGETCGTCVTTADRYPLAGCGPGRRVRPLAYQSCTASPGVTPALATPRGSHGSAGNGRGVGHGRGDSPTAPPATDAPLFAGEHA